MEDLHLSSLLVAEGVLTEMELATLREELGEGSLEDALLERGLIDQETLDRLLSLAKTPLPSQEGGINMARAKTEWAYEVPVLDDDSDEVSPDAPTGRFEGHPSWAPIPKPSKTTRWDVEPGEEEGKRPTGRTTRWEVPVPLPSDDPTGAWSAHDEGETRADASAVADPGFPNQDLDDQATLVNEKPPAANAPFDPALDGDTLIDEGPAPEGDGAADLNQTSFE